MVYVSSWTDFLTRSRDLYVQHPQSTRYTLKYRHGDAELVLKVTDDITCVKFRTHQQSDVKYVERINSAFFKLMTSPTPASVDLRDEMNEKKAPGGGASSSSSSSSSSKRSKKRNG